MSALRTTSRLVLACACAAMLGGCGFFAPTVAAKEASVARVYAELNAYVLNAGELSMNTRQVLHAQGLEELAAHDLRAALVELHARAVAEPLRETIFALSELSYSLGALQADSGAYLGAAVYAYIYLLGTEDPEPPNPYDRRFRWACDLYNRGLERAYVSEDVSISHLEMGVRKLPVGQLDVSRGASSLSPELREASTFVLGDHYRIEGLSLRLRDAGLGVPLIATRMEGAERRVLPVTAFLRIESTLAELEHGGRAELELHAVDGPHSLDVGGAKVPLESDFSVALAFALTESPLWKLSFSGLFEGDKAVTENKLRFVDGYRPGRIPVVFVHGTASNPAYWAEMFNTLMGDPDLREQMQFWFFQYSTGNPIIYSAGSLRDALRKALHDFDPEGQDPALRRMVLVGHSQGGLLVKLMVVDGQMAWFEAAAGQTVAEMELTSEEDQTIRGMFDFDPLPQVQRVVFISTPHGGSYLADTWYERLIAKFIAVPAKLQATATRVFKEGDHSPGMVGGRLPTSLDNMSPTNRLVTNLLATPIAPGVIAHSIIAIGDCDPDDAAALADARDGVVAYSSAHIAGTASEVLVPAGHSCQDDPIAIREMRRILRLHLKSE
jgi:pimeloyl-ACP methyl ester carboxylesterase